MQYYFTPLPVFSKTYKVKSINKTLFTNEPDNILFFKDDISKLEFSNDIQKIKASNHVINVISESLLNKNIKLIPKLPEDTNTTSIGNSCLNNIGSEIYDLIESYRPFGITNPYPIFGFLDMKVISVSKMGKNKEYTKLMVTNGKSTIDVVIFLDLQVEFYLYDKITFTATISQNNYMGNISYNLLLKDILN